MATERVAQSVALRIMLKAFLSSDHVSPASGKVIAVVLSKNGGAFANPSAGATNATEIASGWYYVDLSTTDTGTLGPLVVRGTAFGVDDVEPPVIRVVSAYNQGFDGVPNVAAAAVGGLPIVGTGSGAINPSGGKVPAMLAAADVSGNVPVDKTGYALSAAGLDAVPVETGVNARQALSPILAFAAGLYDGANASTCHFYAGANPGTTRITATTDVTGRTSVTLSLPS